MSLKPKLEAIIYATEEPVTLNELASLLKDAVLADLHAEEEARLASNQILADVPTTRDEGDDDIGLTPPLEEQYFAEEPPAMASTTSPSVAPPVPSAKSKPKNDAEDKEQLKAIKARLSNILDELIADYASPDRGMEIRQVAGGYRMATKPEHHDLVVNFAKSLKPPVRLSLPALETLAVIAYKQPVTVPEISEIRGVDSAGVIATLLDRKLITTAGRKQVIGRPILYKTSREFLLRFGLNDVSELPSMEEFEKLAEAQTDLFPASPANQTPPKTPAADSADPSTDVAANAPDTNEPVTEAVPEVPSNNDRVGLQSTISDNGTYATEAQPAQPQEPSKE